jgi:hypothetical protein
MPGDPNECRMRARHCTQLASEIADPNLKKKLTNLAARWNQIASEIEGLTDPPEETPT